MISNYHTHTTRCNHAKGTEREYIEKAIERGVKTLGFSDHSPYFYEGDYYSNYRMRPEQVEEYVSTLRALGEEYRDQIRILVGYEAEYYPEVFPRFLAWIEQFGYDYLILGQHVIGKEIDGVYSVNPTDKEEDLEHYVDQVIAGMATGKFLYVAHPDIIQYTGSDEIYRRHIRRLCVYAKEHGIPLEVNMLGFMGKRHYPSDRFFSIAAEEGCRVILGSDAHWPDAVAEPETEQQALDFVKRNGLILLDKLI